MQFDRRYIFETAQALLAADSPSGFTEQAAICLERLSQELGFKMSRTNKGTCIIGIPGREAAVTALCAHVDTLGLMVRAIKENGMLAITRVGSPILPTLDGEYCRIYTRQGKVYSGTVLCTSPAIHVYEDAVSKERSEKNLEVRLDEVVKTADDVKALGIGPGDFICIDPKTQVTESGFIKSRFLDDKLGASLLLGLAKAIKDTGVTPRRTLMLVFAVYEEVGHGLSHLPENIDELIAVDMGCIGDDLGCTEYDVSICAKDSTGPYDYGITTRLIELARKEEISHAVDIYPRYGSDVGAAREAGHDIRGALIGPGVHASHGMERAHWNGMEATLKLLAAALL